jgi:pimeloyl-ACP methyl ester carboxylesterase
MSYQKRHVRTPFGDIAYVERGQGPAALFVHGIWLNSYLWRHVIDRVEDVRRCIAVDLLAHGATRIPDNQDVSFDTQAAMLESVCEALGLEQVDVVANDSGGGIAQIFAARHPGRIRSLTLTDCDVHDNWPPEAFGKVVEAVKRGRLAVIGRKMLADIEDARRRFAVGFQYPERVPVEAFRAYLEPLFQSPQATRNLERFFLSMDCTQTVAVEPMLRRLQAPTLVVWGTDDIFFDIRWAYWLRDTIPGCHKVIELKGARLFFPEERPEELAEALREHWQATPVATAAG